MCAECISNPGLCSRTCFEDWHARLNLAFLPAAGEQPEAAGPSGLQQPEAVIPAHCRTRRVVPVDPSGLATRHELITKPATLKRKYPQLKCRECIHAKRPRKDTRLICSICRCGFCSLQCLTTDHIERGIFHQDGTQVVPSTSSDGHAEPAAGSSGLQQPVIPADGLLAIEPVAGPSGLQQPVIPADRVIDTHSSSSSSSHGQSRPTTRSSSRHSTHPPSDYASPSEHGNYSHDLDIFLPRNSPDTRSNTPINPHPVSSPDGFGPQTPPENPPPSPPERPTSPAPSLPRSVRRQLSPDRAHPPARRVCRRREPAEILPDGSYFIPDDDDVSPLHSSDENN